MITIVKLDATDSTNDYIKAWSVKNRTVKTKAVVAVSQKKGRGQYASKWESDSGKNLTFSILYKFKDFSLANRFYLNCAVSIGIYKVLYKIIGSKLSIKWPNDIMADSLKLGGILIENNIRKGCIKKAIIGVGINVNQTKFENLPQATSLKLIKKRALDLDLLLRNILDEIEVQLQILENGNFNIFFDAYNKVLFGRNKILRFKHKKSYFEATILGVNINGKLVLALENGDIKIYSNKEIKFLLE